MKTRLYTMLLALGFCLMGFAAYGQKTIYIIDSEVVNNFSGQQLKGKFIKNYIIQTIGTGKEATILHIITTNSEPSKYHIAQFGGNTKIKADDYKLTYNGRDSANLISMSVVDPDNPGEPMVVIKHSGFIDTSKTAVFSIISNVPDQKIKYVVDGKFYNDGSALKGLKPGEIRRIAIYKEGSPEQLKYGKGFSVVVIDTKERKVRGEVQLRSK